MDSLCSNNSATGCNVIVMGSPGASCSKESWLDFGYQIGSNLENGLFKR